MENIPVKPYSLKHAIFSGRCFENICFRINKIIPSSLLIFDQYSSANYAMPVITISYFKANFLNNKRINYKYHDIFQ